MRRGSTRDAQQPDLRFRVRHLIISVAVAAGGLFLLRTTWGTAEEIIVRQYPEDWRPWNRGHAVRLRLDIDRLRAYNLCKEDVMQALKETRIYSPKRVDPPPGVVFVTRLDKPNQYENFVLKANPEGEIIWLKDVADVEVDW